MGMVRKPVMSDPQAVTIWASPAGTILCTDTNYADFFGTDPAGIMGMGFNTLGTDMEALDRCACARERSTGGEGLAA